MTLRYLRLIANILASLSSVLLYGQDTQPHSVAALANTQPALISKPEQILHQLADHGISFQGLLVHDWSKSMNEKADSEGGYGRSSFDFSSTIDGKKLLGLNGTTGFVRLKNHVDEFGETTDGAAQLYSNIDGPSRTMLYEVYIEQKLKSDRVRLKVGKIDANTEFAIVENAGDFLNSSMGFSPTILEFPTYPEPKLGFGAFLTPMKNYNLDLGVFRTVGAGTLSIVEPGRRWSLPQSDLPGRASFGYWRRDGVINRFDGQPSSVSQGFYSVIEQAWWRQTLPAERGERGLSTFIQLGRADGAVSAFTYHLGGGAVLRAPFATRPHDSLGAAVTWVQFSSDPAAGFDRTGEFVLETYYKLPIVKHIALVQDVQFLHHPGGMRANSDCVMVTPRLQFAF